MPNIVLTRIDNRLVHGQVGASWTSAIGANLIVVADDEAAEDKMQQAVMKMTADTVNVGIRFFSIQKTIDVIQNASPNQKIFLVVKEPCFARKLLDGGVPIDKLNIGNMHVQPGKKVHGEPHVYLGEQDLDDLRYIRSKGVDVYIQIAPGDKKYDFE
ncbi:MAG: PTS N-acetylgalactosamine transporter subunit IIB [Erysipelotrichaceae bacterium]|jgi:PTS system galactosamine-specific IIB component|nr:PTS N-acetylgalactosamine transporter subunit IIB [Erysipelotrichaceae bacterium]